MTSPRDPLDRLAQIDPGTRPPALSEIGSRARTIRRRRSAGRLGTVLSVAAALTVGGVLLPGAEPDGSSVPASAAQFLGVASANASEPGCRTSARFLTPDELASPSVAELSAAIEGPPLPLTAVGVREVTEPCPGPYPSAVLYDVEQARGIAIYADTAWAFAPGIELSDATVQGAAAQWRTFEGGMTAVAWNTHDGTQWLATAQGFSGQEALQVLDSLRVDEGRVTGEVPEGLQMAEPSALPSVVADEWWIEYGAPKPEQAASGLAEGAPTLLPAAGYVRLKVELAGQPWQVGLAGGTPADLTTVGGQPAVASTLDGGQLRLRWTDDGRDYELVADGGTLDDLIALAKRVTSVDPAQYRQTPTLASAGAML